MVQPSSPLLLGLDVGTTQVKAALFNEKGKLLNDRRKKVPVYHPYERWAEQDMELVWRAVIDTVQGVMEHPLADPSKIYAIGLAGQGDGCWLIDNAGKPVRNAILWADGRAAEIVARWRNEGIAEKVRRLSGTALFPGSQSAIVRWLKEYEPSALKHARWILHAKDWVKYKLTGVINTDQTDGSYPFINHLNSKMEYSEDICDAFGLKDQMGKFPPIAPSCLTLQLTDKAASQVGLLSGTPLHSALIDIVATSIGAGAISEELGCSIIGTTNMNGVTLTDFSTEPEAGITLRHAIPGKWFKVLAPLAATPNLDWFIEELGQPYQAHSKNEGVKLYDHLDNRVKDIGSGARGLIYHPYISPGGERAPFMKPTAKANFFGLSQKHTRDHLLRAIYEGVAFAMKDCLQSFPQEINKVRLAGGGSKSAVWSQIICDVNNKVVEIPRGTELGAKGAALLASVQAGIYSTITKAVKETVEIKNSYQPDPDRVGEYEKFYSLYKGIYRALWELWEKRDNITHNHE